MTPNPSPEQLRQHYLQSMGVTPWLPVKTLPGAAPSPQWQWSDDEETLTEGVAAVAPVVAQPDPVAAPAIPAVVPAQQLQKQAPELSTEAQSKATATVEAPGVQEPPPRFRLAMLAYPDCLVVSQMPLDVLQPMPPEHYQLVARILQSVGLGQGEPRVQLFAWPIVNNPNVDQGLPLAQAAVSQLVQRLEASRLPVLVLGQQLLPYLQLPEAVQDQAQVQGERPVVCGPTLNELIAVPGQKRQLWVQLQAFAALL